MGDLHCKFDDFVVDAWLTGENWDIMECRSPSHDAGFHNVSISISNRTFELVPTPFEYYEVGIHRMLPTSGPVLGGTLVLFDGYGLRDR